MNRSNGSRRALSHVPIVLPAGDREFTFNLCRRPLDLGLEEPIDYFWMDVPGLRNPLKPQGENARCCFAYWYQCVQDDKKMDDETVLRNLVLSSLYSQIASNKSLQKAYLDAFLSGPEMMRLFAPKGKNRNSAVAWTCSDDAHVRSVVEACDRERLRSELDSIFDRFEPTPEIRPRLNYWFSQWVDKGIACYQLQGIRGLKEHCDDIGRLMVEYRRRQGEPWIRDFINMFAYEVKAAFYACYANAWNFLVPKLAEVHHLSESSVRFLSIWHWQNQGVEIPSDGMVHTVEGSSYPVAPPDGMDHFPDVFSGQVLALHPISGIIMKDPALRQSVGRLVGSPDFNGVMARGFHDPTYREFIASILKAGHLYRRAREHLSGERNDRSRSNRHEFQDEAHDGGNQAPANESLFFEDVAAAAKKKCPKCKGGNFRFEERGKATADKKISVHFQCLSCRHKMKFLFTQTQCRDAAKLKED